MFRAFRAWGIFRGVALGLLATVAVAYSLTAELTLMSMARADLVAERQAGAKTAKRADNQRDRVETELSKLANVRPAATVKAEIAGILADQRLANCRAMFDPRTRAACPRVASLKAELGNAERREKLEGDLAALQTTAPAAAVDRPADPGAHAVGVFLTALGLSVPAGLSEWMAIVGVISLEVGSALAGLLVASVGGQRGGHQTPSQASTTVELNVSGRTTARPAQPQSASPDTKSPGNPNGDGSKPGRMRPKKPDGKRAKGQTRKLRNVIRLVQREGGHVLVSNRELAKRLGLSKSRTHELINAGVAAGLLTAQAGPAGTRLALQAYGSQSCALAS
jgi:uncharacterized membrane protein